METEIAKRLFTVEEYYRMAEAGILPEDDRVELVDGEIVRMSPIGRRHAVCVNRAATFFIRSFGVGAVVQSQGPLRLSNWTEPQPDVLVFKPRDDFYARKQPAAADVLLLLEVAESSLSYDLQAKLPRYAAAGIPEVWIADLRNDVLKVHRAPAGSSYTTVLEFRPGETVAPEAFPQASFSVNELLTTDYEPGPNEH